MAEAGPLTAVMFHNLADEVGAMGGRNLPEGPLSNVASQYLRLMINTSPRTRAISPTIGATSCLFVPMRRISLRNWCRRRR